MNCFPDLGPKDVHTFHFKGGTYTGTWKEHKPHGQGRMTYAEGSVFEVRGATPRAALCPRAGHGTNH